MCFTCCSVWYNKRGLLVAAATCVERVHVRLPQRSCRYRSVRGQIERMNWPLISTKSVNSQTWKLTPPFLQKEPFKQTLFKKSWPSSRFCLTMSSLLTKITSIYISFPFSHWTLLSKSIYPSEAKCHERKCWSQIRDFLCLHAGDSQSRVFGLSDRPYGRPVLMNMISKERSEGIPLHLA